VTYTIQRQRQHQQMVMNFNFTSFWGLEFSHFFFLLLSFGFDIKATAENNFNIYDKLFIERTQEHQDVIQKSAKGTVFCFALGPKVSVCDIISYQVTAKTNEIKGI
jgi:hypothetical protein